MVDRSKTNHFVDGLLNPYVDTNRQVVESGEFGTTEKLYKASQRAVSDNLDTGEFLGIVLRVDGSTIMTPSKNSAVSKSNIITEGALENKIQDQANLLQLRIRIPKLHSMLPIPAMNPSNFQNHPDNEIIDMYPVFVAKEEDMDIPSPGDVVWVRITNKNDNNSGLYTGVYKKSGYITESEHIKSPKSIYDQSCKGVLSTSKQHSLGVAFPPPIEGGTSAFVYNDFSKNKNSLINDENLISSKAVQELYNPKKKPKGGKGICIGKQVMGYTSEDAGSQSGPMMVSTTGGYQSYKNVPTKVEIFTATPITPPGWRLPSNNGSARPRGLLENRVRKFAFDTLPPDSPLVVKLPEGGRPVHKLLADRVRALNKFWKKTVLDNIKSQSEREEKKITGIWNAKTPKGGLREQLYDNNYTRYKYEMLLGAHTGVDESGNKDARAYSTLSAALSRKAFQSPHETGLAIDFSTNGQYSGNGKNQYDRMNSWSWQWLVNHAWLFGLTPFSNESWHWELLPTRESWETGVDYVDINDPSSGIWVGKLPSSPEKQAELYKENSLLREAVATNVQIYDTIPYSNIGLDSFPLIQNDSLYILDKYAEPMHFPYAVFVRETLLDNSEDHGVTTASDRWTYSKEYNIRKTNRKKFTVKVGLPNPYMSNGEEKISSLYTKEVIEKGVSVGDTLKFNMREEQISKEIYFGWSGNNK